MIRVLIISDVRIYREGLEYILKSHDRVNVIASVQHVNESVNITGLTTPDIVLFDLVADDPIDKLVRTVNQFHNSKIVALAVPEKYEEVISCAEAGVSGFIFRNDSVEGLVTTLERVVADELPCPRRIASMLLRRVRQLAPMEEQNTNYGSLTPRELEILQLIGSGLSNKEIARRLVIEVSTVKNHVHNLFEKLHVRNRMQAVTKLSNILRYADRVK